MIARFELIIFDCDGVLVDSEVVSARVLASELTAVGFALSTADCIARYTGISMTSVAERVESQWGHPLPPDFLERVRARDAAAFQSELQPIEGAREVLAALDWARCVASSGRLEKMRLTLGLTGLLPFVEPHLFSAEMVAQGKPAPDLFVHAAQIMGFPPRTASSSRIRARAYRRASPLACECSASQAAVTARRRRRQCCWQPAANVCFHI
ncbi:MAG: HAD hydrolase-like protein [Rhodospirillales bacterium]|nr:HAD hydrolase-like protein [Rhodospirillales bacterium]